MDKFINFLISTLSLSEEEIELHKKLFKEIVMPKKSILTEEGEVENFLYFLGKGLVRSYMKAGLDKEITVAFNFSGSFFSAYDSFVQRSPSEISIETMEDSVLYAVSHEGLQELYSKVSQGQLMGRVCAEQLYIKKAKRERSLLVETAEQRYLNLLRESPDYIKNIPLKYLASYIGVTPQALSRIRKRIF